ncbi:MAG TPA: class I SAM-dependent methyltransferase [Dehalococcoidia bacterium]|nr:class I SAM-dependent methyltransferase [Dehalococcoidia bacterium]
MAEHLNLYQRAKYYDIIFDRDVSPEVDFIQQAYRHYSGRPGPKSVLDLASGPGYHALEFARRGIKAAALDLRPEMLALGAEKAAAEGLQLNWVAADMRTFRLPQPVDAAFIVFDGLDALLTNEDLVKHFQAVAENLTGGGIYLVDLTHPRDCSFSDYGHFEYRGSRNGVEVEIHWATNSPKHDLVTGVAQVELEMLIRENGSEKRITDSASERLLFPQEIQLLCKLSGSLKPVGWHGDYDLSQPLDHSPASRRMLAVLQRQG